MARGQKRPAGRPTGPRHIATYAPLCVSGLGLARSTCRAAMSGMWGHWAGNDVGQLLEAYGLTRSEADYLLDCKGA